jgi:hypothetical protein
MEHFNPFSTRHRLMRPTISACCGLPIAYHAAADQEAG